MRCTVADCEANQAAWNAAVARAGGGESWVDDDLAWAWQTRGRELTLSFPAVIDRAALRRGLDVAAARGARIVGAWLRQGTDAGALADAGFEEGWEPWWMAAPLTRIAPPDDPRVVLDVEMPEYGADGARLLSLARDPAPRAWHAAARVDGRFAGRAWSFAHEEHAGIYDMEVWPAFRRCGLGRSLLREVCAAARDAGARAATLNATPEGERLYAAEGFERVGTGVTWWLHL